MEIHVHCDCSTHWPQTKGLSSMKYSHLLSFQHQSQDQSRFLVNSTNKLSCSAADMPCQVINPWLCVFAIQFAIWLQTPLAVVKQVISKSRNSTCKLATTHGCTSFNLCQYLYWYTKSHSLLILAVTLKPSMKQGVVTPPKATPRDCDPVYGRCRCALCSTKKKNPHNHSGFGHSHWVTGSLVAQSHGHMKFLDGHA